MPMKASPVGTSGQLSARVQRDLEKVLGTGAQLAIQRTDYIPPSESGKFLYVRNRHRFS